MGTMRRELGAIFIGLGVDIASTLLGFVVDVIPDWLAYGGLAIGTLFIVTGIIAFFSPSKNRDNILNSVLGELSQKRAEGVSLWHEGRGLLSQKTVDAWWQEHLQWREESAQIIEKADVDLAGKMRTLKTEDGVKHNKGISPDHNHKVWMQSAWNNRLDWITDELRKEKRE